MKRLILTSQSGTELYRSDLADAVVCFIFRFVWGPLLSPEELATYLAEFSDSHGPGTHWSTYAYRWPRDASASKALGLVELCRRCEVVELWFDTSPNDQLQLVWLLDFLHFHPDIVARLRLPRAISFVCSAANSAFQRGASFAASIRIVCKCLLRSFEIGPRWLLPADSRSALQRPQ